MPPRYAYWTIIVDEQPTAFRAAQQEDLMPTFKRLKEKHESARMMWFQNGKLWPSRLDAQEAMRERGERGRIGDKRQGGFRDRNRREKPEWRPKTENSRPRTHDSRPRTAEKLEWKPKGEFTPAPKRERFERERPSFKPASPRAPKPAASGKLEWKPRGSDSRPRTQDSRPKSQDSRPGERRKWIPKEEYKKSRGIEAPRDSKWRPGGEHRDPKQKYKDAKKAKWTRFKQTVRKRWESKQGMPPGKKPNKKRGDEE